MERCGGIPVGLQRPERGPTAWDARARPEGVRRLRTFGGALVAWTQRVRWTVSAYWIHCPQMAVQPGIDFQIWGNVLFT